MPSPLSLLLFLSLFSLLPFSSPLTISLRPLSITTNSSNPWQKLNHVASSSLARAHHLKHTNSSSLTTSKIHLFLSPQSYGGYSVSLSFGSPPQTLPFVMDTGSSLVWFPCTHRYSCTNCHFPNVNPTNITAFIPKFSSSAKIVGCKNKKCGAVFGSTDPTRCQDNQICPAYVIQYGSGSTSGLLLSETLDFPDEKNVPDFVVGCSVLSTRQPSGIAGFGRGPLSLPAQLGVKKFSYCLPSHRFDGAPVSGELVLVRRSDKIKAGAEISYTPFHKNPVTLNSAFQDYYYLNLRKITVGEKHVKIPYDFLVADSCGNGGTILDSGTTFTFMDSEVHELVAQEFEKQMGQYQRAADVENQSGLGPCFHILDERSVNFPELLFEFKGGAKLALPLADYFSFLSDRVVCMTLVSDTWVSPGAKSGPSIIIGNYQQQNIYLEFDLEHEKLGFKKQRCT